MERNLMGMACMPLKKNVPFRAHRDWKLVECPICGRKCWESDLARTMETRFGIKRACTECVLKGEEREK